MVCHVAIFAYLFLKGFHCLSDVVVVTSSPCNERLPNSIPNRDAFGSDPILICRSSAWTGLKQLTCGMWSVMRTIISANLLDNDSNITRKNSISLRVVLVKKPVPEIFFWRHRSTQLFVVAGARVMWLMLSKLNPSRELRITRQT